MVIVSDVYHLLPVGFQPTLLYFVLNHLQEPLAHAVSITTSGTTFCTTKSSFVLLFLIEFIACFCCGGYALSHIPQAFLRNDNNHKATNRV